MKKNLIATLVLILLSNTAFAQATTIADIANGLIPQFTDSTMLFSALSYIFGLVLAIKGIFKLKEYNETKGRDVKLHTPIVYIIAATMFLTLPGFISLGVTTLGFDKGGQQTFKY